jgi:trans-aconitate 2-methyltransferase
VLLVCDGNRPSVEDVATAVAARPAYSSWFDSFPVPFHHPDEQTFLGQAGDAGFDVAGSRVEDLAWDFEAPERLRDWVRVGFSAWLDRLPESGSRAAFLDDVTADYARVVGSSTVVRFLQLRVELRAH